MTEKQKETTKRPCLTILETDDTVLIRYLLERGGTEKLRNYWEQQIHVIVSSVGENPMVYNARPEYDLKRKLRILNRNMLMYGHDLLHNYNWQIRQNRQFTSPESPLGPPRQVHRSK